MPTTTTATKTATGARATAPRAAQGAAKPAKAAAKSAQATRARPAARRAAPAAPPEKPMAPVKERLSKQALAAHLAEACGLETKDVKRLLGTLEQTVLASLGKKGAGEFVLPGLVKLVAVKVPATKRRFGKDPFTGQERWFEAKPASIRVRARALKKAKDAAAA